MARGFDWWFKCYNYFSLEDANEQVFPKRRKPTTNLRRVVLQKGEVSNHTRFVISSNGTEHSHVVIMEWKAFLQKPTKQQPILSAILR